MNKQNRTFFEEKGYLVAKGLFTGDEILELRKQCYRSWIDAVAGGEVVQRKEDPLRSLFPRLSNIHRSNPDLIPFMIHPKVIELLEWLSGEEVLAFLQNYYFKPPGSAGIPLHQDNYEACAEPGTTYAVWIALEDSNAENGGLYFVEGTQNYDIKEDQERLSVPEGLSCTDITTCSGDAVIFNGDVYHGSHDNRSATQFRQSFLTHYVGRSVEKIAIGHNQLINKLGIMERRKYNLSPVYHNIHK